MSTTNTDTTIAGPGTTPSGKTEPALNISGLVFMVVAGVIVLLVTLLMVAGQGKSLVGSWIGKLRDFFDIKGYMFFLIGIIFVVSLAFNLLALPSETESYWLLGGFIVILLFAVCAFLCLGFTKTVPFQWIQLMLWSMFVIGAMSSQVGARVWVSYLVVVLLMLFAGLVVSVQVGQGSSAINKSLTNLIKNNRGAAVFFMFGTSIIAFILQFTNLNRERPKPTAKQQQQIALQWSITISTLLVLIILLRLGQRAGFVCNTTPTSTGSSSSELNPVEGSSALTSTGLNPTTASSGLSSTEG